MRWRWVIGRFIANLLARLFLRFRVINQSILLKDKGQILVANHISNFDPFLVALASGQEVYFMAKEELFKISRFFRWLITFWNAMPLPRSSVQTSIIKRCMELLRDNKTIVVFPEGTRNKSEDILLPFKPGIGYLAINAQVPIFPVAILGIREVWGGKLARIIDKDISGYFKGNKMASRTKKGITVEFGTPIYPNGYEKNRNGYEQLTQVVRNKIKEMITKDAK